MYLQSIVFENSKTIDREVRVYNRKRHTFCAQQKDVQKVCLCSLFHCNTVPRVQYKTHIRLTVDDRLILTFCRHCKYGLSSRIIFVARYEQRRAGSSPTHIKSLQSKNSELEGFLRVYASRPNLVFFIWRDANIVSSVVCELPDHHFEMPCHYQDGPNQYNYIWEVN